MLDPEPGKIYRVTRFKWNYSHTLKFIRKSGNGRRWVFELFPHPTTVRYNFNWYINPAEVLQIRELTAEEVLKVSPSTP